MRQRDTGLLTTDYIENTLFHRDIVAYAYRTTTMQLMIRGFGFTDAKRMVRISGMLGIIDKMGVLWHHNKCIKHCADWVEREIQSTKRTIVDWTGIIFASDQRVSSTTVCLKGEKFLQYGDIPHS